MIPSSAARRSSFVAAGFLLVLTACSDAGQMGEPVGESTAALSANEETAFDYFVAKGLTTTQAAGIVGNLVQESNVDPTAVEAGGPGRGIAQWSVGGRWDTDSGDNVLAYATKEGESSSSLALQLDFIWYELTTFSSYGLTPLRAATNVTDATVTFETDFEGCGECDQSTRIAYAEAALAAYGNSVPPKADAGAKDAAATADAAHPPAHEDAGEDAATEDGGHAAAAPDAAIGEGHDSGASEANDAGEETHGAGDASDNGAGGCSVGATREAPSPWTNGVFTLGVLGVLGAITRRRRGPRPLRRSSRS